MSLFYRIKLEYQKMFFRTLLLLSLLSLTFTIPSNKTLKALQAGHFVFQQANEQQSHLFMWQFETAFGSTPQLAMGIDGVKMNGGSLSNNFDLSIQVITNTGVIVKWNRQIQRWVHISINYFASTRPDVILGSSQVNLLEKNEIVHVINFNTPIPHQQSCIARMYLTGCCTDGQIFDCKIVGKEFTPNLLSVTASIGPKINSNIKQTNISLSYIIFSPAKASFSSFGGMIDEQNFKGLYHTNVRKVIYKTDYILYGFSMLTFQAINGQHLYTTIDGEEVMTIEALRQTSFRMIYIALGKSSKESCKDATYPYQWQNECLSNCPAGTFAHKYANGGQSCMSCPSKLNMFLGDGKCYCKEGFVMENNDCVKKNIVNPRIQGEKKVEVKRQEKEDKKQDKGVKNLLELFNMMKNKDKKQKIAGSQQQKVSQNNAISHQSQTVQNIQPEQRIKKQKTLSDSQSSSSEETLQPQPKPQTQPQPQVQPLPQVIRKENQNSAMNNGASLSVGPNGCGPNAYMMGGMCFCKPGFKKVNGQCVSSDTLEVIKPIIQPNVQLPTYGPAPYTSIGECGVGCTTSGCSGSSCSNSSQNTCPGGVCSEISCQTGSCNQNSYTSDGGYGYKKEEGFNGQYRNEGNGGYGSEGYASQGNDGYIPENQKEGNYEGYQGAGDGYGTNADGNYGNPAGYGGSYDPNGAYTSGQCASDGSCASAEPYSADRSCASGQCASADSGASNRQCESSQCDSSSYGSNGYGDIGYGNGYGYDTGYGSGSGNGDGYGGYGGSGDSTCVPPAMMGRDGQCYCPQNQIYFNNQCIDCQFPGVFDYISGTCDHYCGQNAEYLECRKECVCRQGFGVGKDGKCEVCQGEYYLSQGYCVSCPDDKVYDQEQKRCVCPKGTFMNDDCECTTRCGQFEVFNETTKSCICRPRFGRDEKKCKLCDQDEIVNEKGLCEECDDDKSFFFKGKCICKKQFAIAADGQCQDCSDVNGAFVKSGWGCVQCPNGFIKQGSSCVLPSPATPAVTSTPSVVTGNGAQQNDQVTPAIVNNGDIQSICGNGLIQGLEQCDDKNTNNGDGCSSTCTIQPGYECTRMPSRCKLINGQTATTPTQGTTPQNPTIQATTPQNTLGSTPQPVLNSNLALEGKILGNSNQIFLTLNTVQAFNFPNEETMKNFIKVKFTGCPPPTMYCGQKPAPKKHLFDCLLLFPSGIPTSKFQADFSYNYQGSKGWAKVDIDPLTIHSSNRRRYSRNRRNNMIP